MARVLIEVCVDSAEGLAEAVAGGADRIELCAALDLGGITPSAGLMQAAARCPVPVLAMIRPRAGDFVFSPAEVAIMLADIAAARAAGLAGVVLGASLPDGRLDDTVLARLTKAAAGLDLTLHRAFDLVPDMAPALDLAAGLGFRRILTSGQAATATQGRAGLERCFALAGGRIAIMPGSGISAQTVPALRGLPLTDLHGSCSVPGRAAPLGFGAPRRTSAARVRDLRAALAQTGGGPDAQLS
ncbi:MAG: copper homeostasis protein CutC [Rhodobacter sp.]|nr:copper homeostasis protein CutC [Rhodobacter sp.]